MSREKQTVEEMAKVIGESLLSVLGVRLNDDILVRLAEHPYNAGYRKQSEGEWELHGNDDDLGSSFFCSLCGWNIDEEAFYRSQTNDYEMYNYCPRCGAKMKGGAE